MNLEGIDDDFMGPRYCHRGNKLAPKVVVPQVDWAWCRGFVTIVSIFLFDGVDVCTSGGLSIQNIQNTSDLSR